VSESELWYCNLNHLVSEDERERENLISNINQKGLDLLVVVPSQK
jgi:hypothetical protein